MMAYVRPDFKRKKDLIDAVERGDHVTVYQPGLGTIPYDGEIDLEGPHAPRPHSWYAEGIMKEGKLVKVR
jgi:hypothetical protein